MPCDGYDMGVDLISFLKIRGRCSRRRNNLISVCYGVVWLLWKSSCDWVFKNILTPHSKIMDSAKSLVFTWLKHRRSNCHYKWAEWCICPLKCL
uniref:Uncharacterized protein n=1 Tax=Lactuca sativa TaxID=4236 RepID=A0A9R1XB56_LACSA|nr:hypothetical protein LSAT_V11C500297490 [Lactuca sativa]